jgi:predicted nicotinamide N-methyase
MDLKQFLELFNPYPGNSYLQVTSEINEISDALYGLMEHVEGIFNLVLYTDEKVDLSQRFANATTQQITNLSQPFRALPRTNDIVIFSDIFHKHSNQDGILKIAYTTLANAGEIIIMQKKGTMDIEKVLATLEEFEFRSQNYIDLLPEYDLVMAKKLHMWGNGL